MTVGSKDCYTGYNATILAFLGNPRGRSPLVEPPSPRTVSPQAKPYNGYVVAPSPQGGNPAAASESARVQPFKCLQEVMLATRNSAPLRSHETPEHGGSASAAVQSANARLLVGVQGSGFWVLGLKVLNPKPRKNRRLRRSEHVPSLNPNPEGDRRPRFRSASVILPWIPGAVTSKPNPKP
jgi:hypothetical protein